VRRSGREPDAAGKKETTMALLDSAHRVSTVRAPSRPLSEREIHPAISLVAGFGFIIGAALLVHVGFLVLF
jgi:hypothetical protein